MGFKSLALKIVDYIGADDISYRKLLRAIFLVVIISLAVITGVSAYQKVEQAPQKLIAPPSNDITVISTNVQNRHELIAYGPNGSVIYYNDTHDVYHDIDESPEGYATVLYVASDFQQKASESGAICSPTGTCTRQVVEKVNLSTGEVERIYTHVSHGKNGWHDVDMITPTELLVADLATDEAYIINISTGEREWSYDPQHDFPISGGGHFPGDWTHINDVEQLSDGRIMINLRNQDQVIFVDPGEGLEDHYTLGEENDYDTLYEQHNPDHINSTFPGPALLVADSENNRIIEYQRKNGTWQQSWVWEDSQLQWPRDADRLPNGNTLIVDSNGGRVLEVNQSGQIVWEVPIRGAYDAERLGTGSGSNGPTAASADLQSRAPGNQDKTQEINPSISSEIPIIDAFWGTVKNILPSVIVNSVTWILPRWMTFKEVTLIAVIFVMVAMWLAAELYWSAYSSRSPIKFRSPLIGRED